MKLSISESQFLLEYWQQKPLLLPQALPNFSSPISADELAGFAMEEDIESRLISRCDGVWKQQEGPFAAQDFRRDDEWTLLVQSLDQWHEGVAALRSHVAFLPRWRFDDIMVSYASDGAGVGPHFDRYDVFLLQGSGCREWRIGTHCGPETPLIEANDLSLIPEFEPSETYVLSPGDILYVPPGIAHWGIAKGESLTFSLGFRAPAIADLLARLTDNLLEQLDSTSLLEDAPGLPAGRPGEISKEHIRNARDAIANAWDALDDNRWLGQVVTGDVRLDGHEQFDSPSVPMGPLLRLSHHVRIAWTEREQHLDVFINGDTFVVPATAMQNLMALCRGESLQRHDLCRHDEALYDALVMMSALEDDET
jgi:50S ribosomal protein L16 3-hydroxylase